MLPEPAESESLTFAQLFRSALRDLRGYLRTRLRDASDVEDVAQEAFLRMWRARGSEQIESPRSYLFRVATNIATDRLRERQRWQWAPETEAAEAEDHLSPERTVAAREELALVRQAIERLPTNCRQAFTLRLEGRSHAEIAAIMGISKSMVEKHMAEALARLDRARTSRPRGR